MTEINIEQLETHFPLSKALLCSDCDAVYQSPSGVCPSCTCKHPIALIRVLDDRQMHDLAMRQPRD